MRAEGALRCHLPGVPARAAAKLLAPAGWWRFLAVFSLLAPAGWWRFLAVFSLLAPAGWWRFLAVFSLLAAAAIFALLFAFLGTLACLTVGYHLPGEYGYFDGGVGLAMAPVAGKWELTGRFGEDRGDHVHMGIDLACPEGTPVLAVAPGRVRLSSSPAGGLEVWLYGEDGRTYYYAHLSGYAVSDGEPVSPGRVIGYVGSTGRSTGPHLHFGVMVGGKWVDPLPLLRAGVLPEDLAYRDVDEGRLAAWLRARRSMLADRVGEIIRAAREVGVDPLLLVAITGQEQGFVPEGSPPAMLGNPFNVYGSWQRYSPGLYESARIAARTVVRLSRGRPEGVHPIYWLSARENPNGVYAEDPNWWRGVTYWFEVLKKQVL
ncbi:M23 family metallopeptidase [Desulfovirgula thermocuniculi]|uniref:M23 family metallopeptidase n=1 Tax=Desulfovirgula thermocuniculi TaxID=348842 RepID=UPI0012EC7B3F|nr:M23 family metallopeptidase [Desulfovirgula thermocuniculi]